MKQKKHFWIWFIIIGYICFIFHNSMTVASASESASLKVSDMLLRFFNHFSLYTNNIQLFNHYVRKLAHFSEYALLGFLVLLALLIYPLLKNKFLNYSFFLICIPFLDEMLQNFYDGRSCQISDMFLDALGFLFGSLILYIIYATVKDLIFLVNKKR